jgi:hypothetical protein
VGKINLLIQEWAALLLFPTTSSNLSQPYGRPSAQIEVMSTSLQQLPPVSRYYIRRLLQQSLEVADANMSGVMKLQTVGASNDQIDRSIEDLLNQDGQAEEKLLELERLALLFHGLSTQGTAFSAQMMSRVEYRVANLLGLELGQPQVLASKPLANQTTAPRELPARKSSEYLVALNSISQISQKFVGKMVTAKTWRACRPPDACIAQIQVSDAGELYYIGEDFSLNSDQKACLKTWRMEFIRHCSRVIRNFEQIVKTSGWVDSHPS